MVKTNTFITVVIAYLVFLTSLYCRVERHGKGYIYMNITENVNTFNNGNKTIEEYKLYD